MGVRLILVCKEGPSKEAYLHEANSIGIEVDTVPTFGDLFKAMMTNAYQGVMVDLVTSVRSSREEKGIAQEILDVFPLIQLKWDQETNNIHTLSGGVASSNALAHFVSRECRTFTPRAIRLNARKEINFNILMSRHEVMNQALIERSVTVNISKGGCFLFSCQDWSNAADVWLVVNELKDKTPIHGEIRWRQAWGTATVIPGIGISIKQITPQQMNQLVQQYSIA